MSNNVKENTKEYYGKVLKKSSDLKTNACCTTVKYPKHITDVVKEIHDDVITTYYGCGLVIPDSLKGCKVLDLGSGSGRDVYILSKLVGQEGQSIGVDMTDEQLAIANSHVDYHTNKFGYEKPNVKFLKGDIEKLDELGLEKETFDVVVSNCVVNLAENKEAVLRQTYDLLQTGGEMYFSDVYSDRRIPEHLRKHEVLWGECLSGALYLNDFLSLAKKVGFTDPRMVSINRITIRNKELEKLVGNIKFCSVTYRLFKLPGLLDDNCEDYGQAVVYNGTMEHHPNQWQLDDHHVFETGKVVPVCQNTFNMLYMTRFRDYFTYIGKPDVHYGIFPGCGQNLPFNKADGNKSSDGCC